MNAKITLTVPMDRIPREITRLLDDINVELQEIISINSECINNGESNILQTIEKIDSLRKKLNLIDFTYEDCYTILLGYVKYQSETKLKQTLPKEKELKDGNKSNG